MRLNWKLLQEMMSSYFDWKCWWTVACCNECIFDDLKYLKLDILKIIIFKTCLRYFGDFSTQQKKSRAPNLAAKWHSSHKFIHEKTFVDVKKKINSPKKRNHLQIISISRPLLFSYCTIRWQQVVFILSKSIYFIRFLLGIKDSFTWFLI